MTLSDARMAELDEVSKLPRPAPCHQTAAWKAGHKRECAQGQGAAAAALIRRAARPAPQQKGACANCCSA